MLILFKVSHNTSDPPSSPEIQPAFEYNDRTDQLKCLHCQTVYYFSHSVIRTHFLHQIQTSSSPPPPPTSSPQASLFQVLRATMSHGTVIYTTIPFRCISCCLGNPTYPFQMKSLFTPNSEQREVIIQLYHQLVITPQPEKLSNAFLVDGSAGTGKTSTIMYLFQYPEFNQFKLVFSAPTNKALQVMMEKFNLHPKGEEVGREETELDDEYTFLTLFKLLSGKVTVTSAGNISFETHHTNDEIHLTHDIIVVDEASMIDQTYLTLLMRIVTQTTTTYGSLTKRHVLIFMGDSGQLPPVGEEDSQIFQNPHIHHLSLSQIMRSRDQLTDLSRQVRQLIPFTSSPHTPGYLSLKSMNHLPIQAFTDRQQWLQCYLQMFQHNLHPDGGEESHQDRSQGAPIIICYTNEECETLNQECRNLIFNHPTEPFMKNELLVFRNSYRIKRWKQKPEGRKEVYYLQYYTSEQVLVRDSTDTELSIPPLNWKNIIGPIESFVDSLTKWLRRKVPHQQADYLIPQLRQSAETWVFDTHLVTQHPSVDTQLNRLLTTINQIPGNYWVSHLSLDDHHKLDPLDTEPEQVEIKVIATQSTDGYMTNCDQIRLLIKTTFKSLMKRQQASPYRLLWDYLFQAIWKAYYRQHVWPFANIAYGYAITTYKSQGSTYAKPFVNISNILGCRKVSALVRMKSLYTAMTRASQTICLLYNTSIMYPPIDESQTYQCQICKQRLNASKFAHINHNIDMGCADRILAHVSPMNLYQRDSDVVLSDKHKNLYLIPNHVLPDRHLNDAYHYLVSTGQLRNFVERYQSSNLELAQTIK